jgi:deoxyribodipyrimidine photo-lyase
VKSALVWLRRDLRLEDHAALFEATRIADRVFVVFVFDATILKPLGDEDDRRVTFIHQSLQEISVKLAQYNSKLIVIEGDPGAEIPRLARQLEVDFVVAAQDFEQSATARDAAVEASLREFGCEFRRVVDHVVQPGASVLNQSGLPFRVFTPYSKQWRAQVTDAMLAERAPDFTKLAPPPIPDWDQAMPVWRGEKRFKASPLWLEPGENAGRKRLQNFVAKMGDYSGKRDFPGIEGTSALSVHLRFGTVSIRECFRLARQNEATKWESELIWREFYSMLLSQFPEVETTTFQPQYRDLEWPGTDEHFARWCEGQTGYPIVDAGMRILRESGWMHNRVRMIVASFLTKDLLVDYRKGEAWFARQLLDFDLASNNGGWQWAASVGCDAQPYFRIFNPVLQSRKFDPSGAFILQACPELASLSDEQIHWPHGSLFGAVEGYPGPIVDHAQMKERAIALLSR